MNNDVVCSEVGGCRHILFLMWMWDFGGQGGTGDASCTPLSYACLD